MIHARIINLKERGDRWQRLQPLLQRSHLRIERFDAVRVDDLQAAKVLSRSARATFRRERKYHHVLHGNGAVGCALSHIGVWREFLESDAEHALVLEDDIDASSDVDGLVQHFLNQGSWDIALLGWMGSLDLLDGNGNVVPFPSANGFFGAHAYMLTRKAAQLLVDNAFPLEMQLDYYIQTIADEHGLRIRPCDPARKIKQVFTGISNVFSLCIACNMGYVYAALCVILAILIFALKHRET
jgi:GR25 family glycosyltransferase involved in LPS biosynthesis